MSELVDSTMTTPAFRRCVTYSDYYAAGSRTNAFLRGFTLSSEDRRDILAFLESLTDQTFLHDPAFAEP